MTYELNRLAVDDDETITTFHQWKVDEPNFNLYTCRPVKKLDTLNEYKAVTAHLIEKGVITYYLSNIESEVLGKITLFDYNLRNKTAEFGYYLPEAARDKGYGSVMISKFIEEVFKSSTLCLNKLYATTASGNSKSINILKKHHFTLDGILREHYWIDSKIEDQLCFSLLRREWATL